MIWEWIWTDECGLGREDVAFPSTVGSLERMTNSPFWKHYPELSCMHKHMEAFKKAPKPRKHLTLVFLKLIQPQRIFFPSNTYQYLLSVLCRSELEKNKVCFCLPFCIRSGKLYVFINSYHTLVHLKFVSRERVMRCYRLDCGWPDEDIWHKWMKSFYLVIDHFKNKRRPRTHQKAYHENLEIRLSPGTGIGQSGALKKK